MIQGSDFLTGIAKGYCEGIDEVLFCDLPEKHEGIVFRDRATNSFVIYINRQKHICSFKIIFTLFHEIGHIVLSHFDIMFDKKEKPEREFIEIEADNWALRELDLCGSKWPERSLCDECIRFARNTCFLNIDDTRRAAAGIAARR